MFSPDAPILSGKEDLLDRANFASALARAIDGTEGADSFVVGIHGKWGTGKSSVLNLTVEQIEVLNKSAKSDEQRLYVLRFNPWNFSDQNQLVFQFLKQFRAHLLKFDGHANKKVEQIVDTLDEYAEALAPPLELIPYGGKILSHVLKFALHGAQKRLGFPKEIEDIYNRLAVQSASLKRRTVVLIDDIDRLNSAETRQIFQLVKLTARFPYVTYVLAFDRTAVAAALKDTGVDSGEEYLEKIVQVSFDLPAISEEALSSLLTKGIESLLVEYTPAHFDTLRFGNIFHGGFRSSFESVRHVRRFLNGLEFSLSLIGKELNGADIIGIEALKTFYPKIFEAVKNNQELFAGHIDSVAQQLGSAEYRKKLDVVLPPNELNEDPKGLLIELFPRLQYAYSPSHEIHGPEWGTEWEKEYRVASTRYFGAYFRLTLGPLEISRVDISRLIDECGDVSKCSESFKRLARQGKLKAASDSLRFRLQGVALENLPSLLTSLVEAGDIASESGSPLAGHIPEYWHVRWALFDVLDRIPAKDRPDALLKIAGRVLAPRTMVNVLALIEDSRKKEGKYSEFTDEEITKIRSAVAGYISAAAENGELQNASENLSPLLYAWRNWGKPNETAAYVKSLTDTDEKLARFLNRFIYQTHSATVGDHTAIVHNKFAMKQLSESLDLTELREHLSKLDVQKLSSEERDVIWFAKKQIDKMFKKKLTPEQFDNSRFFDDA
jgi:hypothetical protein